MSVSPHTFVPCKETTSLTCRRNRETNVGLLTLIRKSCFNTMMTDLANRRTGKLANWQTGKLANAEGISIDHQMMAKFGQSGTLRSTARKRSVVALNT